MLIERMEDEFDLFPALLLKCGDDFPDRCVFFAIDSLVPPHHEVGGLRAERREGQRGNEKYG
jgi:hypothetical protein